MRVPSAVGLTLTNDTLSVELSDGRTLSVPLAWFPRLLHATPKERLDWRLVGNGEGIHWPAVDEDISVEGLIAGKPSAESAQSLKSWLSRRAR
jgi:hypothetical protein